MTPLRRSLAQRHRRLSAFSLPISLAAWLAVAREREGGRQPVALLYSETYGTLSAAVQRERQIKRWTAVKKQTLIDGRIADLKRLAARRRR